MKHLRVERWRRHRRHESRTEQVLDWIIAASIAGLGVWLSIWLLRLLMEAM